jgi:hypothetical protein
MPIESPPEEISLPGVPDQEHYAQLNHQLRLLRARLVKDYGKKGLTLEILDENPPDVDKLIQIGLDKGKDIIPFLTLLVAVAQAENALLQTRSPAERSTGTLEPRKLAQSAIFPKLTGVGRKTRKHGHTRVRRRARGRVSRRKIKA